MIPEGTILTKQERSMRRQWNQFSSLILVVTLALPLVFASEAFSQAQKNFLWSVRSKTATVYLLGSVHFFKKEFYPLNKKIEEAFDQSRVLAVEANIVEKGNIDLQKIGERAFYPESDRLEKHVSAETYDMVKKEGMELGLPLELLNRQRPWILALTLETIAILKLGFDPRYGIDVHFLSKASGRRIVELEGLDYQINLLSTLSDEEQESVLLMTLKGLPRYPEEVDQLMQAWLSGDANVMDSIMTKDITGAPRMSSIYDKLFSERNRNMVSKIEEFLKAEGTYFVVVGAGHLAGQKGMIEILREKGYLIDQL